MNVSATPYSLFRFLFGCLMVPQILSLVPFIHGLSESTFVFHYPYLDFIEAYSHTQIDILKWTALFGACFLALGIYSRLSALLFLLSYGYLFLIDRTFYNNHYYLWCLLAFLFVLSSPKGEVTIFNVFKGGLKNEVSTDVYIPFVLIVCIVYFYGGLVKINPDWLQGYPMIKMYESRNLPFAQAIGLFVSYSGILFDLFIWVFLLWRPTFWPVVMAYVSFHAINYFTFNIGEFPLVMIAAWLLFLPFKAIPAKEGIMHFLSPLRRQPLFFVYVLFFVFQIAYPLRAYFIPGNVAWHRQGYYFSWRMMLNNHESEYFQYLVELPDVNKRYWVDFEKLLTARQYSNTYHDSYHIWLLGQKLGRDASIKYKSKDIRVYCKSVISLNQHQPKMLIDNTVNLIAVPYNQYLKNTFIIPF